MRKSLSSDSARALSQKQQKEAWRHAAPDAWERIYRHRRSGSVLLFLRCANISGLRLLVHSQNLLRRVIGES